MPDRLQSAYEDVEHELHVMTEFARLHRVGILFVAGDGLALMRLNHLLANKQHLYMDQTPVVIPIQGARHSAVNRIVIARARNYKLRVPCHTLQVSTLMGSSI